MEMFQIFIHSIKNSGSGKLFLTLTYTQILSLYCFMKLQREFTVWRSKVKEEQQQQQQNVKVHKCGNNPPLWPASRTNHPSCPQSFLKPEGQRRQLEALTNLIRGGWFTAKYPLQTSEDGNQRGFSPSGKHIHTRTHINQVPPRTPPTRSLQKTPAIAPRSGNQ